MRGSNHYGFRPVAVVKTEDEAPLDFSLDKPKRVEVIVQNVPLVPVAAKPAERAEKSAKVRKFRERKYADQEYWLRTYLMNPDFQIGIRDGFGQRPFVERHRDQHAATKYEEGRLWGVSLRANGEFPPKMPRPVAAGGTAKPNGKMYAPAANMLTAWHHWEAWNV